MIGVSEIIEKGNLPDKQQSEKMYRSIRVYVVDAQKQVYTAVNTAMVNAYWNIGKAIYEICGENDRATYGKQVLAYISERLTEEFGNGYTIANLRNMRQFYLTYQKHYTLCSELSWSHYRLLMRVDDEKQELFIPKKR